MDLRRKTKRPSKGSKPSKTSCSSSTRTALRVIAPYTTFDIEEEPIFENKLFSYYITQKPEILLTDWSNYLNDSDDLCGLLQKSSQMLKQTIKAKGVNLYIVDVNGKDIYYATHDELNERYKIRWRIKEGTNVAAYVAHSLNYVMVDEVFKDSRFPQGVAYHPLAGPVICCPIVVSDKDCYGVIELYREHSQPRFTENHLEFTVMVTSWISVAVQKNLERLKVNKQWVLNDYLLNVTRCFFADPTLLKKTINDSVNFARVTLNAHRGSFVIFDNKSIDGFMLGKLYEASDHSKLAPGQKVILNKKGIIEYVARTGETSNIRDGLKNDSEPGPINRSVLCMPILCGDKITGVIQVKNKKHGGYFTEVDEMLFKTFSLYCSFAVYYSRHHKKMQKAQYLSISYERLLRFVKPCIHDFVTLCDEPFEVMPKNFYSATWHVADDQKHKIPKYILYMFIKIIGRYSLFLENAIKFILLVKKSYPHKPYHNFEHAFQVAHIIFLILTRNMDKFSSYEKIGLLIGGLCHDIDHSGFSNSFLKWTKDDIALLYEDSCQENYHFFVTLNLLNASKMFKNFTPKALDDLNLEIKKAILATDLCSYFKMKSIRQSDCSVKTFSWTNAAHRAHVKHLIMTSSEWAFVWKPYPLFKITFFNYFKEQFREGEMHKILGRVPILPWDKKKLQSRTSIEFNLIRFLLMPCLRLLKTLLPNTKDLYNYASNVDKNWEIMSSNEKIWCPKDFENL